MSLNNMAGLLAGRDEEKNGAAKLLDLLKNPWSDSVCRHDVDGYPEDNR